MKHSGTIFLLLLATAIGACGGGGGGSDGSDDGDGGEGVPAPSPVEGFWSTTSSDGGAAAIVLDDGRYWLLEDFFYWLSFGAVPRNVTIGSGSGAAGTFHSSGARQFSIGTHGAQNVSVVATYVPQQHFNGTVRSASEDVATFTLDNYDAQYAQPFALSRFDRMNTEGLTVIDAYGAHGSIAFATDGAFSGTLTNSCSFHGTLTPRARGSAFDLSVSVDAFRADPTTTSPQDCVAAQYRGVAYLGTGDLYMVGSDSTGNALFLFAGSGPLR